MTHRTLYFFGPINPGDAMSMGTPVLDHGRLLGTTYMGGSGGIGTVWLGYASGAPVGGLGTFSPINALLPGNALHNFGSSDGMFPAAGLVSDGHGQFFGVTTRGGAKGLGEIFSITASGRFRLLHSFEGGDGSAPWGSLTLDGHGNLLGTTREGGTYSGGSVFSYNLASHRLTTLHSFNGTDGAFPVATLTLDGAGNIFGVAAGGGLYGSGLALGGGTVFEIAASDGSFTKLHDFAFSNEGPHLPDGIRPAAQLLVNAAGDIFGTTAIGGEWGHGTLWEILAGTTQPVVLHSFLGGGEGFGPNGIVMDAAGNLFGTCNDAGFGYGTLWRWQAATGQFDVLDSFYGDTFGAWPPRMPTGALVADEGGTLYGASSGQGSFKSGAVYAFSDIGFVPFLPNADAEGVLRLRVDAALPDASFAGRSGLAQLVLLGTGDQHVILGNAAASAFGGPIILQARPSHSLTVDGGSLVSGYHAIGGSGEDLFIGGSGNDTFSGGGGPDVFDLGLGGTDRITDFDAAQDSIRLAGLGLTSFADLAGKIRASGGNTLIVVDASHKVLLMGVAPGELGASDFIFS